MKILTPLLLLCLLVLPLSADDAGTAAGHSSHGEAFNEGPRQSARRIPRTGTIDFPITTASPRAQAFFNQGVGQLHGFWYFEAERSFRQVLKEDPACSFAYWGMAMANANNKERAAKLIKKAEGKTGHLSAREQAYVNSLADYYKDLKADDKKRRKALVKAYENLIMAYPDDLDAKAFLVVQLWENHRKKMEIQSPLAVNALIEQVLAVQPNHPIHHYRIHLWDYVKASVALSSAAACGPAAPDIAHMWHMPGHIYSKLKRYGDAAWQQEASARTDHRHMMHDHIMPDRIHNYAHNNEWLARNLGYVGRVHDAINLAANMVELPRVPKFKKQEEGDTGPAKWDPARSSYSNGIRRLYDDLLKYELWERAVQLDRRGYLDGLGDRSAEAKRLRLLAIAHYELGKLATGDQLVKQLEPIAEQFHAELIRSVEEARQKAEKEKKKQKDIDKAVETARKEAGKKLKPIIQALKETALHRLLAEDTLNVDAIKEVEDLAKGRQARLYAGAGDFEQAEKLAREEVKRSAEQVYPLASLADILWRADKKDEALKTLDELHARSAQLDLDWRPIKRLAPAIAAKGWNGDWRKAHVPAEDLGERPPLDTLGPFRWRPGSAPDWELRDSRRQTVKLSDFRGKPVVLIFYLGAGCSHCIDQLNAFAPKTEDFRKAGLHLVAVSTDTVKGLKDTFDAVDNEGEFPFPIVSDARLKHFKTYRAYDDFEKQPLHGTFLIDEAGRIRWQDISYEPFMHPEFVIEEAQRLLKIPVPGGTVTRVAPSR